jgi:hypothetical protein
MAGVPKILASLKAARVRSVFHYLDLENPETLA